ncbi:hypothetical protein C8Q70DRAFT_1057468 [Cubamyces menziesii]|nr:hypothetical protein C8Q70DRAFT_1057468 [Cubamyces menziesii]
MACLETLTMRREVISTRKLNRLWEVTASGLTTGNEADIEMTSEHDGPLTDTTLEEEEHQAAQDTVEDDVHQQAENEAQDKVQDDTPEHVVDVSLHM